MGLLLLVKGFLSSSHGGPRGRQWVLRYFFEVLSGLNVLVRVPER